MKSYWIGSRYLLWKSSIKSVYNAEQFSEHIGNESVWNFLTVSFPVATIFKCTLLLISKCSVHKQTCQEDEVEEWPHSKSKSWQTPCKWSQQFKRIIQMSSRAPETWQEKFGTLLITAPVFVLCHYEASWLAPNFTLAIWSSPEHLLFIIDAVVQEDCKEAKQRNQ